MSSHHARDYERFWTKVEARALEAEADPAKYHKPLPGQVRISKATVERLMMNKHDRNKNVLYKGKKVRSIDQLINLLLDESII